MAYSRTTWADAPDASTPITAARLNNIEGGLVNAYIAGTGGLVNADIAVGAAIAYAKLALTGSILNADLAGSIAYSKLALTGAILNADLAGSIAYSKLSLTGALLNADVSATAAIAGSKLNVIPATTLNASPTNGEVGLLTDSTSAPTYVWAFVWNSSASKWMFTGGSAGYASVDSNDASAAATNTFGDFANVGPSFTVPRAGSYQVDYGGQYGGNSANSTSYMGVLVGATTPSTSTRTSVAGTSQGTMSIVSSFLTGSISASTVCKAQGADGNTGSRTSWSKRYVSITPVYVT